MFPMYNANYYLCSLGRGQGGRDFRAWHSQKELYISIFHTNTIYKEK